jgi:hypothetical protein
MKKKITTKGWHDLAHKNATHMARLHLEVGNAAEIAEAFKSTDTLKALEYLFQKAEKYRRENKHAKAAVLLEAATLIDRATGAATEITLTSEGSDTNEQTTLSVRRYSPEELFNSPIILPERKLTF